MKQVLYFFPLNPADNNAGSISRALGLFGYFSARKMHVDFISKHDWGRYTEESLKAFEDAGLAASIRPLRRKPVKKNPILYFFTYKIQHLLYERKLRFIKGSFPNQTTLHLRRQFDKILQEKKYDYIIISYAYWADLIKNNPFVNDSVTIIDTHDFLASQHQHDKGYDLKVAVGDELRRLSLFDQIWTISTEETYLFRQFFKNKVRYIPMMLKEPRPITALESEKKYDLIYVAKDTPHNEISSKWFLDKVYPLLPKGLSICIIGTILNHIPKNLPNITRISFADDLSDLYYVSKVALCPMLSGTGVKVKVIEAMAHALPIVCSTSGVDGLPNKTNNGCLVSDDANTFAANVLKLLNDASFYNNIKIESRKFYENNFRTEVVYKLIDDALNVVTNEA
jgi:glycosyltransferase involved in cell wall biosynthesis